MLKFRKIFSWWFLLGIIFICACLFAAYYGVHYITKAVPKTAQIVNSFH